MNKPRTRRPALDAPLPAQNPEFRQWRFRMELSQPAAAEALGLHPATVAKYDRGEQAIDKTLALAMTALENKAWRTRALALIRRLTAWVPAKDLFDYQHGDLTPLGHEMAAIEGWDLFGPESDTSDNRLEIQRDDEANIFPDDTTALSHVRKEASTGSTLHAIALELHNPKETTP